jgi:hypothetical protein
VAGGDFLGLQPVHLIRTAPLIHWSPLLRLSPVREEEFPIACHHADWRTRLATCAWIACLPKIVVATPVGKMVNPPVKARLCRTTYCLPVLPAC